MKKVVVPAGKMKMAYEIALEEASQRGLKFKRSPKDPKIQKLMHKHLLSWYEESIVPNVRSNPRRRNPSTPKVAGVSDTFENLLSVQGELGKIISSLNSNNPKHYTTALKGAVNLINNLYMELGMKIPKFDVELSSRYDLRRGDKVAMSGKVFQNRLYRAVITTAILAFIEQLYKTNASDLKSEIQRLFPGDDASKFASSLRRREFLDKLTDKMRKKLESFEVNKVLSDINDSTLPVGQGQ